MNTASLPVDITPLNATVGTGAELKVVWPEDPPHVSVYPANWLCENLYWSSDAVRVPPLDDPAVSKSTQVLFDASTFGKNDGALPLPAFPYDAVMKSDASLYEALKAVSSERIRTAHADRNGLLSVSRFVTTAS